MPSLSPFYRTESPLICGITQRSASYAFIVEAEFSPLQSQNASSSPAERTVIKSTLDTNRPPCLSFTDFSTHSQNNIVRLVSV
jgi:hypothetical protein